MQLLLSRPRLREKFPLFRGLVFQLFHPFSRGSKLLIKRGAFPVKGIELPARLLPFAFESCGLRTGFGVVCARGLMLFAELLKSIRGGMCLVLNLAPFLTERRLLLEQLPMLRRECGNLRLAREN